ncbi:MAG: ATP-binding protein [Prevotellaceae bacterium]|jgi:predicted HTH transcriptional regulator|nr:ATP-binding protein [Prevotellaceae bacterium]
MDVNEYINKLIEQGEHQRLDFKFAVNDSKKIARTLAAFANTDGGTLLLGVKDNGRIVGVNSDEEYYMMESAADLYCKPSVKLEVQRWQISGKVVLEVIVQKSDKRPHLAPDKNGKYTAYIRVKDENFIASPIQVKVWKKKASKQPKPFVYSHKYDAVLDALRINEKLTLLQLSKKAFSSEKEVEEILIELILAQLVSIETTDTNTYFSVVNTD